MLNRKFLTWGFLTALGISSLLLGQQCAKVELSPYEEVSFLSLSANPYRLDPPIELPQIRKIILFLDMSYSMVSGPCPQDVDQDFFNWNLPQNIYDPNKGTGNPNDHRLSGIDCQVDLSLNQNYQAIDISNPDIQSSPKRYYRTFPGADFDKKRIQVTRHWLRRAREENPPMIRENTWVMVLPLSGGKPLPKLIQATQEVVGENIYQFLPVTDSKLDQLLSKFETIHDDELQRAINDDVWRYEKREMGTTVLSTHLNQMYEHLESDMRRLNELNQLQFTDYQLIYLTEGNLTPVQEHFQRVLATHPSCSACATNPQSCSSVSPLCGSLTQRMIDAWGNPSNNDLSKAALRMGMISSLPFYFGTGFVRFDFAWLNASRYNQMNPPGRKPFFDDLKNQVRAQNFKMRVWQQNTVEPSFHWVNDLKSASSFELADFYVLNLNYRMGPDGRMIIDSDGDGLGDSMEAPLGALPNKARTNGYFLDGMAFNPVFSQQIEAISRSGSCDPHLDSDGDSLNECEETLLGTNPFDFDSDHDGIPDSWEWLYGLNPMVNDSDLDSNGDGVTNKVALSWGLPPQVNAAQANEGAKSRYQVNFKGKDVINHLRFGSLMVELYEIIVQGVPVVSGTPSLAFSELYNTRIRTQANRQLAAIPESQQILSRIPTNYHNQIVALARIIDRSNPDRIYWRLFKTEIPISNVYKQPQLDLSLFKQIRARDYNN